MNRSFCKVLKFPNVWPSVLSLLCIIYIVFQKGLLSIGEGAYPK